jgi:hypothetical protein
MRALIGQLLCLIGVHDSRVIDTIFGFGPDSSVTRKECRLCGRIIIW